ncbi:hypothetical protein SteCoe_33555 [Stentor coeruleus]|uniref:Uncharacterized protein n=1 Tax=Stentor coeruleus TaxID=5963 RepID=A0A1R2AWF0_9CILI|nr:hypothetical protein SteCoe_33555 [Stentor coeruleus]
MEPDQVKIVLIGEARVGKSSIISRYISNTFQEFGTPTLGCAYHTRQLNINDKILKLNIWDTAGQERYHSLSKSYSRDSKIIILVYDITSYESFKAMKRWHEILQKEIVLPTTILGVFGNKADLIQSEEVPIIEAQKFANVINASFRKTSAKENAGIEEGLIELCKRYLKIGDHGAPRESLRISKQDLYEKHKKSKCCGNKSK